MTEIFTIDGRGVPIPDAPVPVTTTDVEGESARDRSGMLHRTVLRRVKSWEFTYRQINKNQYNYLLEILIPGVFQFAHPEGISQCCCKGFSADYYDAAAGLWHNFRFRIEEV